MLVHLSRSGTASRKRVWSLAVALVLAASRLSPVGAQSALAAEPIVNVAVDERSPELTVTAQQLGSTIVRVTDGGGTLDVPVRVLPAAGRIPDRLQLTISGNPATADFLASRLNAAVAAAIKPTLVSGSTIRTTMIVPLPERLERGFLTSYRVAVTVEPGHDSAAVAGWTTVDVVNAALPAIAPAALAFADDPERITADGVLSRTIVRADQPARIYYYHQDVGVPRRFCVVLAANDSVLTRAQLVGAAAGPDIDVMSVGHAVTKTFLALKPQGEGTVVTIAGGKPYLERDETVAPGDGIVGALDVHVLDGGPVTVTVMAIPPDAEPQAYLYAPKLPDDGHSRHGTFELQDYGRRVIAYTIGGPDAVDVYGTRRRTPRNLDPADIGHDYGDYGVLQHVAFDVDNPGAGAATVYLYEKPLGGVVRSSFVVNGSAVDVGCVRIAQRYLIAPYELGPHATATLDVLTMTDGGSNYPLEIGVSATAPLPAAPPISAQDGCFPKPGAAPAAAQPQTQPPGQ